MTRHLPVGKHYPKTILLLVLLAGDRCRDRMADLHVVSRRRL